MGNYRQVLRTGFLGIAVLMVAMVGLMPQTAEAAKKDDGKQYSAAVHKQQDKVIRAGQILWDNWSWNTEVKKESYRVNSYNVLGVQFCERWAGLYLHHKGFSTKSYDSIQIHIRDINSTLSPKPILFAKPQLPKLTLWLVDAEGDFIKPVHLEPYAVKFQDSYFINVPLSALKGTNKTITGVVLQDRSGKVQDKWWVDSIVFR